MKRYISLTFLVLAKIWLCAQDIDFHVLIEDWRQDYHVPGVSVGIIYNGNVMMSEGFGVLEEGKPERAGRHTLYAIASNTKAFISASVATLVKDGKMSWDDRVQKHLPYFELYDPCVSEMITVRDLLCHRAGLGTFSGDVIWYRSASSAEEVARRAAEIPRKFEFRSGYGYSNVMYITAGEVIRAVTGKPWDDYVRERFLSPLGMTRTLTSARSLSTTTDVASPHKPNGDRNDPLPWVEWNSSGATGGIISSVDDMLKWMLLQLDHGIANGDTLFTPALQREMWTPHNNFTVSDASRELYGGRHYNGYGLGWTTTEYHGMQVVSHTGGYDGMYSAVVLLPGKKTGIVVLTNTMRSIAPLLCYEIIDRLMDHPQKDWRERGIRQNEAHWKERANRIRERTDARFAGTQPTMSASAISGLYRCPMFGDIWLTEEAGGPVIDFVKAPGLKAKLSHWHYDTWRLDWLEKQAWFEFGTVQIRKDNNGHPESLLFDVPNDDIFFEEIHAVRVNP